MARQTKKLTALAVKGMKEKGLYSDGEGLYLRINATGAKSWVFRFTLDGKAREMGLGPFNAVSLAQARNKAGNCRTLLDKDTDPIEAKRKELREKKLEAARAKTFKQCAEAYIEDNKSGWRNKKHADQWTSSLNTYAYPFIGDMPVQDVDVNLVLKVLEQKQKRFEGVKFWEARPTTANRIRNRIELVLDWAKARTYRVGENPARWRGHLKMLLPHRSKMRTVKHHPALPYDQVNGFIEQLNDQKGIGVEAFELLVLTATRTGEVIGAKWSEFDLDKKIWIIPDGRIKTGKEHRIPLSDRAVEILQGFGKPDKQDDFVFSAKTKSGYISKMALITLLKRMDRRDITVHGFRSTFRDWCAECTHFSREVAEQALSHTVGNAVENAYRRGDLFEKRRQLMDSWAEYCATPFVEEDTGKVVKLVRIK